MLSKTKRLIIIIFGTLIISDVANIIKTVINIKEPKFEVYGFLYTIISGKVIIHLSLIYALIVLILYFSFNFFKNKE